MLKKARKHTVLSTSGEMRVSKLLYTAALAFPSSALQLRSIMSLRCHSMGTKSPRQSHSATSPSSPSSPSFTAASSSSPLSNLALYSTSVSVDLLKDLGKGVRRTFYLEEEGDLEDFGFILAGMLSAGDVVLMRGNLGAGKTTLSRGIIRGKVGDMNLRVTSPSYLLDNTYAFGDAVPQTLVHHIDLYRLPPSSDLSILGIPAIFTSGLCLIEWPERLSEGLVDSLPPAFLDVYLTAATEENERDRE